MSGSCASICQRPLARCGPRDHAEPGAPGHQGSGSKRANSPALCNCQPRSLPDTRAAGLERGRGPCVARGGDQAHQLHRVGGQREVELGAQRLRGALQQRTLQRAVDARRPRHRPWRVRWPPRSAAARRAAGSPPCRRRASRRPGGAGAPVRRRSSCSCSRRSAALHCPLPVTRPALARSSASCASRRWMSMRSSCFGVAPSSTRSSRTGTRLSSSRPGSWLRRFTSARAGWSRPAVCTSACASIRVRGAALLSAPRSSERVDSSSCASGQASNGWMRAVASSDGARRRARRRAAWRAA